MQVTEDSAAAEAEQLAHERPAVERWLTWSGLVPLSAFLVLHLALELGRSFSSDVSDVLRAAPSLFATLTSLLLVWLPLAVHVGLGASLALRGQPRSRSPGPDVQRMPRLVSRVSGWFAFAFLAYHARTFPFAAWLGEADPRDAGFRLLEQLSSTRLGVPVVAGCYVLGLAATVTHAGLAMHRGLLAEGRLRTTQQRRASARACAAFGALLFCAGAAAVIRVASGVLLR